MDKIKKTKADFDKELLAIVHTLRGYEVVKIKKDDFGKPGRIIIMAESTTILDYSEEFTGDLTEVKKKSIL